MQSRAERRVGAYVLFVRDWITQLRLRGGDFSPVAASRANEVAYRALRQSAEPDAIFQAARSAYYSSLYS